MKPASSFSKPNSLYSPHFPPFPTAPLRVAGYSRVSTELQREKESIKTQNELIQKFCTDNGHILVDIYADDGISGTTHLHERPEANRMLADATAGRFDALLVYKSDRIGRDVLVNEVAVRTLYDGLGIDFKGIAESIDLSTPIGRAMFTFQSAIGRLERENTLQRSRDATLRLAKDGVWLGGITPYGFRIDGKGRLARLRLADEEIPGLGISEVDVIRLIYRLAAEEGKSCSRIAETLNELGIPTSYARDGRAVIRNKRKEKTREVWTAGRLRNMIVETTYYGVHRWGKRFKPHAKGSQFNGKFGGQQQAAKAEPVIIERAVPAIVDEATWKKAQLALERNRLCPVVNTTRPYLLRGLIKCRNCGRAYVGSVSDGAQVDGLSAKELEGVRVRGNLVLRSYYRCLGRSTRIEAYDPAGRCLESGHVYAPEIEELVWKEVLGFLQSPDAMVEELRLDMQRRYEGAGAVDVVRKLEEMRRQKMGVEDERAVLFRLFRKGSIKEVDLERQLAELEEEENKLTTEIEQLEGEVEKARDVSARLERAGSLLERHRDSLSDGANNSTLEPSWEAKRRVIEELVHSVQIESALDLTAPRGQQRTNTLHITYSFEPLELISPRGAKASAAPTGLSLTRTHIMQCRTKQAKLEQDQLVREALEAKPGLNLDGLVAWVLEHRGVKLSRASACRIRARLGLAPDNIQSRAAKAKYLMKKVEAPVAQ